MDNYIFSYKIGILESDLDEMKVQDKVDFCAFISSNKWKWGTNGVSMQTNFDNDFCELTTIFHYKIILYTAGVSHDSGIKIYYEGKCISEDSIAYQKIESILSASCLALRDLCVYFKDKEYIDLDSIVL